MGMRLGTWHGITRTVPETDLCNQNCPERMSASNGMGSGQMHTSNGMGMRPETCTVPEYHSQI